MLSVVMMMAFTERQNRKLLEQLEEQKKRLRMQTQQQTAGAATTGLVFVCAQCTLLFNILFKIFCVTVIIQNLMQELIHSFVHFWHAALWVRSAKRTHHFPEWMILSHVNCFVQGEVQWFQVLLGSLHPHSMGRPGGLLQFSKGKLFRSAWHLIHMAFAQCGRTGRDAVLEQ